MRLEHRAALPGPTSLPIFQVHPLQRCNLACLHCYSDSSPTRTASLTWPTLERAVRKAAEWGYRVLSVSGGEPLLYPWLAQLLSLGRASGMATSIVTNGLLIGRADVVQTLRLADVVAVSVDGLSESHNQMRLRPRAFERVIGGLLTLREAGIPFCVSCGVTPLNIGELDDLAGLVCTAGALALQLHPVENSGRAAAAKADLLLDEEQATAFFVLAHMLKVAYAGRMVVNIDAVHRITALAQPRMLYAGPEPVAEASDLLAAHLGVLVLDPFGNLMPLSYGFANRYWFGNIDGDLDALRASYFQNKLHLVYELGRKTLRHIAAGGGPDIFNPSDILARASHNRLSSGSFFSAIRADR